MSRVEPVWARQQFVRLKTRLEFDTNFFQLEFGSFKVHEQFGSLGSVHFQIDTQLFFQLEFGSFVLVY
jgi:hypothetical protein